jgi:Sec61beta family protein
MLRLYTDESPGLKVDPVVVLVLSLVFIFSVVALHSEYLSLFLSLVLRHRCGRRRCKEVMDRWKLTMFALQSSPRSLAASRAREIGNRTDVGKVGDYRLGDAVVGGEECHVQEGRSEARVEKDTTGRLSAGFLCHATGKTSL